MSENKKKLFDYQIFIYSLKNEQHIKFLNYLENENILNNEIFNTYIKNPKLRLFILKNHYLNNYLSNPFNKESGIVINYYLKKNIITKQQIIELFDYKFKTGKLENLNDIKELKKWGIEELKIEYFLFCKNFTTSQIINFHKTNKEIINQKITKILDIVNGNNNKINLLKKQNFLLEEYRIIFYYHSLITQKEFCNLEDDLKEEIFDWYKKIYKTILKNFISQGNFLFSILKKMTNIFYNFNEELYDEIEDYQEELFDINKEFEQYKFTEKLNKIIKFHKFYNEYIVEEETLEDIVKEDFYYIYLIDLKYINIEYVLDLIENFSMFSNDKNKYNFYISKLLLLFNKFNIKKIFLNDIKKQKKYFYILFNELLTELIDTNEDNLIKEEYRYVILKLLQKYEFPIENNNNEILIEMIFKLFDKKNYENLSSYYANYIYLYIKNNYGNNYKKKLEELIKKHNLIESFLGSKYLFEEKVFFKKIIKDLKDDNKLITKNIKEYYLKNSYFDLSKQAEFFKVLSNKDKKLYLLNNPNINIYLLKIDNKYLDLVLNNKNYINNLIFKKEE